MDATEIRRLQPKLQKYLAQFADCFSRSDTRGHLTTYVHGQLSNLERKSVEPIALAAGVAPRTLQQFLSFLVWDQDQMIDSLQYLVARDHTSPRSIGLIDETACPKKGDQTPGVQRQWCGATGKQDNCVVTVHLGYTVDEFHALLDSELYLPESWAADRGRCRSAGIPDAMTYRPKWQIALELYDRAVANGVSFRYLTFDEGYGGKPEFLRQLQARGQMFVAEVPRSFTGWLDPPAVTHQPFHRHGRGRGRKTPRLVAGSAPARSVEYHLNWTAAMKDQPWLRWRVKDTQRGPLVWETKHMLLVPKDEHGLPGQPLHLIVARNVRDTSEIKFFVSNAPSDTPLSELLLVAFSRWHVERCFEDQKTELGFDHFEGRCYLGLKRHQAITAVTHLFLARVHQELRGEKTGADGLPGAHRSRRARAVVVAAGQGREAAHGGRRDKHRLHPSAQRGCPEESYQDHAPQAPRSRHRRRHTPPMPVEHELAL
jgi:SRSO17 transposase